jgi:hypothetical protein
MRAGPLFTSFAVREPVFMNSYERNFCRNRTSNLPTFDIDVQRRGRRWGWFILTSSGECLVEGRERSRAEARYRAARALFQLLASSPYQKAVKEPLRAGRPG